MKMKTVKLQQLFILFTLVTPIVRASWSPIEDIPIEYYQPEEYQESHIDHEVLLRPSRTADSSAEPSDLKEQFFRSFDDEFYPEIDFEKGNLPRPGGFIPFGRTEDPSENRKKRQIIDEPDNATTISITPNIEDELGTGPLELDTLNPLSVTTEPLVSTTEKPITKEVPEGELILINDFIRFRRGAKDSNGNEDTNEKGPKRGSSSNGNRQKFTKSAKITLENENLEMETNREPRGLTRQEWVKFPYQLQQSNEPYADSSGTDLVKAPRVHFVTQRRSENVELPLVYRNERQGRDSDLPREARGNINMREKDWSYRPRFPSRNGPPSDYAQGRYEPRRNDFRGRYDGRSLLDDRKFPPATPPPSYSGNRQRRIIYYANLPEITRSPPSVDFRDRYRYRDTYAEKYPVDPLARKMYRNFRFDEDVRNTGPYSLRVSKDVNVHQIEKNPERRIYSEVGRKFNYDNPSFDDHRERRL
ncbi:hypothetical protein WA026_008814 [Henosepilachna vigintioctopunctata]|uniref:Uncharacterized protein n=1 Tax=Henosepilachna vigintioctopunctata TaxID=420089 RepID=A0AAW1VD66_9CUCU